MNFCDTYTLDPLTGPDEPLQVWSRLQRAGHTVLPRIDGTDLIAQVRCPGGHLLMLGYDPPFEEGLHLVFLDEQDRPRDEVRFSFSQPEGIGIVTELRVQDGNVLTFNFYGRWRVQVDPRGVLGVSRTPTGVYRLPGRLIGRHRLQVVALAE